MNARLSRIQCCCIVLLTLCLTFSCHARDVKAPPAATERREESARLFERWQIIGEGTDFLAVQIECPKECPALESLSAVALDADGLPLRRITCFPHPPQPARSGVAWFFCVLFDPNGSPAHLRQSQHFRFTLMDRNRRIEKTVDYMKTWKSDDHRVFDSPLPPDVISGRLVLCDYVFWADGDSRVPAGPHVLARIHHSGKQRQLVEIVSDIQGADESPEIRIETDRGWLELATGHCHSMQEAVAPTSPYVEGWWDGKGCFHPDPPILR
jgi:hypothetical protein